MNEEPNTVGKKVDCTFTYNEEPTDGIINAVAWVKGIDPIELEPLYEAVDAEALDALAESVDEGNVTVEFTYAGCEVRLTNEGTVTIQKQPIDLLSKHDPPSNILVIEQSKSRHRTDCRGLLGPTHEETKNLLLVTTPSDEATNQLTVSPNEADQPANLGLITIGDFTRSASTTSPGTSLPPDRLQIANIPDPSNLSQVRLTISKQLSTWEENNHQTVVCFSPLNTLLEHTSPAAVFRFLHILTSRIETTDTVAHYHLDKQTCDDHALETLKPLFDTVIEIDEAGNWEILTE
jgi:hypothetical protein